MTLVYGHFAGQPGQADTRISQYWILLEQMTEVVVTAAAIRRIKLQLICHNQQINTHLFTGMDTFLVARPELGN